jgi:thiaminase
LNRCCQPADNPADYPDDLPGVRRFRDGMLRTARQGSYEQIVTLMFGAEWMYYFWCRRASEHRQSDADVGAGWKCTRRTNFISRLSG